MSKKKKVAEMANLLNAILFVRCENRTPSLGEVISAYVEKETGKPVPSGIVMAIDRKDAKYLNWVLNGK